jgi:predicted Zn-dependent protease
MSAPKVASDAAFRVADRLKHLAPPWDVFAERCRKFEVHLSAGRVELVRGPVQIEGYGIRVLRPNDGSISDGLQASTDFSDAGIASVTADAEANAKFTKFPARSVELPSKVVARPVEIADPELWNDPSAALDRHVTELLAAVEREPGTSVTFGSVKVTLSETTLANSSGLSASYAHALVQSEIGILNSGGPEGSPPGEYWVTGLERRLETSQLANRVNDWARFARDARRASAPPTGQIPVILPADVLEGILPGALGFQCSGAGRLHEVSPPEGTVIGPEFLDVQDDGLIPWAVGSGPFDDEGVGQQARHLVEHGRTKDLLCDLSYASAIGRTSTGSGFRRSSFGPPAWYRFTHSLQPSESTISIPGGSGGSDEELIESARDGIWVQQLGWASPSGSTTAFGGEIRIGYRIRNGKLAEPLRGGTVGGRLLGPAGEPSFFRDLGAVGRTPKLVAGVSVPSLLTRGVTVSGESGPAAGAPT